MTTGARASAGNERACPRPGRRLSRPLSRGGAGEAATPTPVGRPRYRQAGGNPPLRTPLHRGCSPRAGAADPSNGAWHCLAGQDHRQGRSLRSRRHGDRRKRRPLSSDLPRKDHRHLSGWTEPPGGLCWNSRVNREAMNRWCGSRLPIWCLVRSGEMRRRSDECGRPNRYGEQVHNARDSAS